MAQSRKFFLKQIAGVAAVTALPQQLRATAVIERGDFEEEGRPDDEKFWHKIASKYYSYEHDYINLENGYYGIQSDPVKAAYQKNIEQINKEGTRFTRKVYPGLMKEIKEKLAIFLGTTPGEIIITRNTTEAMNIAIQSYPFQPTDEVVISQLDYSSMIETFKMLEKRKQIILKKIELPLAEATEENIVEAYSNAITRQTKVFLLTQVSNVNGLVLPVEKITALAREKGIDCMIDAAHAIGQMRFDIPSLGADFVGLNLHKWIGNPIGAGVLYVKKEKINLLKPFWGDVDAAEDDIQKLAHYGTTPFAINLTIPDSLAFHALLGAERIGGRLHYLKQIWINECKINPAIELITPSNLSCAIASFTVKEKKATEVVDYLLHQHKILTIGRSFKKLGCVRVTPSILNTPKDMQQLAKTIKQLV